MLESALNAWMGKSISRYLLVHAGVVERRGWALVLPGASGAGKSTLSTVLASRGWRFLSDEIAIIRPDDGLILPHPRPVPLKNDSIDMMTERLPEAYISKRYEGTTKGTVAFLRPPSDAIQHALEPAKPKIVVFPQFDAKGKTELKRLEKAPAFMRLVDNSPQYFTLLETGFETLAAIVEACVHYKLTYDNVDSAISLIESLEPDDRDKTS
jgi:HprK-related kinase A